MVCLWFRATAAHRDRLVNAGVGRRRQRQVGTRDYVPGAVDLV